MTFHSKQHLKDLIEEVFYKEDRISAELRLYPEDADELTQSYNVKCVPMDGQICADGKRWYHVWLLKL